MKGKVRRLLIASALVVIPSASIPAIALADPVIVPAISVGNPMNNKECAATPGLTVLPAGGGVVQINSGPRVESSCFS